MATDELFRVYDPAADPFDIHGYPLIWHTDIKYLVRQDAGHRCVRCGHPYVGRADAHRFGLTPSTLGGGWSQCDDRCTHRDSIDRNGRNVVRARLLVKPTELWAQSRLHPDDVVPVATDARWRILTVHHLDGDKANCRWWNLAALCQRCHLQIQGKVVMTRVWPWDHSDWFRPYVAGYYAHAYLAADLTRAETTARLDELLALEHA